MTSMSEKWLRSKLKGAYEIDLNVSYDELGSIFHPEAGTAVGDLTERVRTTYGSALSSLSTNGTTASNVLMLGAALCHGREVVLSRSSHTSLYGALVLFDAIPHYVPTDLDPTWGVPVGPAVDAVVRVLEQAPGADVVALTIPTYFGLVAPVRNLVTAIHQRGQCVVIDAAHGAHFRATPRLPEPIEAATPDIVTHSIHKVSCALSQASLLHIYSTDPELKARFFQVLNTIPVLSTSFSVPIIASIEVALDDLADRRRWDDAVDCATDLGERLDRVEGCRVVRLPVPQAQVAAQDVTRLYLDVSHTGVNGHRFARLLYENPGVGPERSAFRQLVEMATPHHVLLLVTSAVTRAAVQRLVSAFERIVHEHGHRGQPVSALSPPAQLPPMVLTPRQAFDVQPSRRRRLPATEAARYGCVSAETVATFPPGAPIIVAGEMLRPDDVSYLQQARRCGAALKGASDQQLSTIEVIDI